MDTATESEGPATYEPCLQSLAYLCGSGGATGNRHQTRPGTYYLTGAGLHERVTSDSATYVPTDRPRSRGA